MKYFSWKNHNLNIEIPNDAACIKSISVPILLSNIPIDYGIASIQVLKLTLSINLNLIFQHFLFAPRSFHIQSMLPWLWKNLSDERKNIQRILMSGPEMEIRPECGSSRCLARTAKLHFSKQAGDMRCLLSEQMKNFAWCLIFCSPSPIIIRSLSVFNCVCWTPITNLPKINGKSYHNNWIWSLLRRSWQ